ncbi:hypothetical protein Pmar_PMAR012518 [Perkinsus marinus ATCC 50983]|uniref:Uncharacterized protein n=1 Tax=Perkinsus marinus (strain ATCC 50983 / TXsc) TaxID=423536 RepID=C5K7K2_PERM5|nr:hypothetical protein Pmar_PMAR012518 [Perkinsus marinus ATCC 50983]EER19537.1 hypothetical protein Pmar_PMAR012518 [Perkinsus marinus ATCC 50983]|eukprot:XP_002787741.1 hypothetical protein Pmar_PMAR012518 [Perkinsus marinus ATCC 50983]
MLLHYIALAAVVSGAVPQTHSDVVNVLNERFNLGKPSDDMDKAGVLLHHFSKSHAGLLGEPWRPYTHEECALYNYPRCNTTADRSCAYISNNRRRNFHDGNILVFSVDIGGIIYDPYQNEAMCVYSEDGGSDDRTNRGCGCHENDSDCLARGTNNSCVLDIEAGVNDLGMCWWGPENLKRMMHLQSFSMYNEVVLDTDPWLNNLPHSINAFFYIPGAAQLCDTLNAYDTFNAKYPDSQVPLVQLDITADESPFSLSNFTSAADAECPVQTAEPSSAKDSSHLSILSVLIAITVILSFL